MTAADIRKQLRNRRNQLSSKQQSSHANQALQHFQKWLKGHSNTSLNIALFLSQDGELSTTAAIEHLWSETKHQTFLPALETKPDLHMGFVPYYTNSEMKPNQFGIPEPDIGLDAHLTAEAMDIILVPLVGFDKSRNRLGMGGGYYDRSLEFKLKENRISPVLIGWAHSCQQVDQVPKEPWDVPLDMVITERGVLNT